MTPAELAMRAGTVPAPRYRDTGALQRRSPLPRGTYWIDIFGRAKIDLFAQWLTENGGIVAVITSEENLQGDSPSGWYLFKVTGGSTGEFLPQWDPITFGYPTIATPDIHSKEDTAQRPGDFSWVDWLTGGTGYGTEEGGTSDGRSLSGVLGSPLVILGLGGGAFYLAHRYLAKQKGTQ